MPLNWKNPDSSAKSARSGSGGEEPRERILIQLRGAVQGVGFRPFVYALALRYKLAGYVTNTSSGVTIEAEGGRSQLESFLSDVRVEKPVHARLHGLEVTWLDPAGYSSFSIRQSRSSRDASTMIMPDIALCRECRHEIFDPENRRYRYPFTNCTHCGPRFTIIQNLPYDRKQTTMSHFTMCAACLEEFGNPANRRFHAQPNACPDCGPQLQFWSASGQARAEKEEALQEAVKVLRDGGVLAVKGLGGFHLMADPLSAPALARLREIKQRSRKPFAVMFSSAEEVSSFCDVSEPELKLLRSPEAPIVLLEKKASCEQPGLGEAAAPGNPCLGVMIAYTPLHALLLKDFGRPLLATSANLRDEIIVYEEEEAVRRFGASVDGLLTHNRPILQHADDSIVRWMAGREMVLRRARGFSSHPILLDRRSQDMPVMAFGAHMKATVAASLKDSLFLSQHIGDLENAETLKAFTLIVERFKRIYNRVPERIACDLHPAYWSTQCARKQDLPVVMVQHHYAHVLACMAENQLRGDVLGIAWDGTGMGTDETVWGGEFLKVTEKGFKRQAHLATFPLPGGEKAVREPRRVALGILFEMKRAADPVADLFSEKERSLLEEMMTRKIQSPRTSSAGRLFDGVAALLGLCSRAGFEGEAAMALEFEALKATTKDSYPVDTKDVKEKTVLDWRRMVEGVLLDRERQVPVPEIAAKFHNSLVEMILIIARKAGCERIALTGGCFQNKYLTEKAVESLRAAGFKPYWHQRIPPNDGGISIGQIMAARREIGHVPGSTRQGS